MKRGDGVLTTVPNYYGAFHCIGKQCRHNCCIGWEIDIDAATAARYRTVGGALGERLSQNIAVEGTPHFITNEHGRCPFLNAEGLCDIQLTLGESYLCDICADHPRFRNALPDRLEIGLGLCCEEAARLILTQQEPMTLLYEGDTACEDAIVTLRDEVICLLQDRTLPIPRRIDAMLEHCGATLPAVPPNEWTQFFLSLERLDEEWTTLLNRLKSGWQAADTAGFDRYMAQRQTEYEQLLVYFIYRHFANAPTLQDAAVRAAFAAVGYTVLYSLGAVLWAEDGEFTIAKQLDLARMFSAEIEYSDENFYLLLDQLGGV